jgi:hypothetical protein
VVIGYGLHEYDFRTGIFCYLFDLEFPEVGCLNLDLTTGDSNDTILGGLNALADFLAFTHIEFHGLYLHTTPSLADTAPVRGFVVLIYQLVYVGLYLLMAIVSG